MVFFNINIGNLDERLNAYDLSSNRSDQNRANESGNNFTPCADLQPTTAHFDETYNRSNHFSYNPANSNSQFYPEMTAANTLPIEPLQVPAKKMKLQQNGFANGDSHFAYGPEVVSAEHHQNNCIEINPRNTWNLQMNPKKTEGHTGKRTDAVYDKKQQDLFADMNKNRKRVLIIPHNKLDEGVSEVKYWYPWIKSQLKKSIECQIGDMPDPHLGREVFWVPYMCEELHVDKNTILIGHGIGACAALRFAEDNEVRGVVVIDPAYKHHDDPYLKAAYYFDREWNWDKIRNNSEWFLAFTSHPNTQTTTNNSMVNKKQQPHNNPPNIPEINNLDRSNTTTPNLNGYQNQEPALRQEVIELLTEQQIASLDDQKFVSSKLGVELQSLSSHSFETTLEDIFDDVMILVDEFQQE